MADLLPIEFKQAVGGMLMRRYEETDGEGGLTAREITKRLFDRGNHLATKQNVNRTLYGMLDAGIVSRERNPLLRKSSGWVWKHAPPDPSESDSDATLPYEDPNAHGYERIEPLPMHVLLAVDLGNIHGTLGAFDALLEERGTLASVTQGAAFADTAYSHAEVRDVSGYRHLEVVRAETGHANEADTALVLWVGAALGMLQAQALHEGEGAVKRPIHVVVVTKDQGFRGLAAAAPKLMGDTCASCTVHFFADAGDAVVLLANLDDTLRDAADGDRSSSDSE